MSTDELSEAMGSIKIAGGATIPSRWKDDPVHVFQGLDQWREDVAEYRSKCESLGYSCPGPQPRLWASVQTNGFEHLKHQVTERWVTMVRIFTPETPGDLAFRTRDADRETWTDWAALTVPVAKMVEMKEQGWQR